MLFLVEPILLPVFRERFSTDFLPLLETFTLEESRLSRIFHAR